MGASTQLHDSLECISSIISAYSGAKSLFGAAVKLRGNVDKPGSSDFNAEMKLTRGQARMANFIPQAYHELDLRIVAWRAIEDKAAPELRRTVDHREIKLLIGDAAGQRAVALQASLLGKLVLESTSGPATCAAKSEEMACWLQAVLDQDAEPACAMPETLLADLKVILALVSLDKLDEDTDTRADLEDLVSKAKACENGPLFHFRVSNLGMKIMAEIARQSQDRRSQQVFDRRWSQIQEEMSKLMGMKFAEDVSVFLEVKALIPQLKRVQEGRKFLRSAPSSFWNRDRKQVLTEFDQFCKDNILPALGNGFIDGVGGLSDIASFFTAVPEETNEEAIAGLQSSMSEFNTLTQPICEVSALLSDARHHSDFVRLEAAMRDYMALVDFGLDKLGSQASVKTLSNDDCVAFATKMGKLLKSGGSHDMSESLRTLCSVSASKQIKLESAVKLIMDMQALLIESAQDAFEKAAAQFNASLLRVSPNFKQLLKVLKVEDDLYDPCSSLFPVDFSSVGLAEELVKPETRRLIADLGKYQRDASAEVALRDTIVLWKGGAAGGRLLRELQVSAKYEDVQVHVFELLTLWTTHALAACPSHLSYKGASLAKKASSSADAAAVGESDIVPDAVVRKLVVLGKLCEDLQDFDSVAEFGEGESKWSIAIARSKGLATDVCDKVARSLASRWMEALRCGAVAADENYPAGDWKGKAIDDFDEPYVTSKLLTNPKHVLLAQSCEWMEHNKKRVQEAVPQLRLGEASDLDATVWKKVEEQINNMKVVIGAAVVYHITVKRKADFADKADRVKAVAELRATMTKSGIALSDLLLARLEQFES